MSRTFFPTIDFRPVMSTVRNQGQRPTCVAFAVTSAHEVYRRTNIHDFSEEFLFRVCKIRDKDFDDKSGTFVHLALINLERLGQSDEAIMPYQHPTSLSLDTHIAGAIFRNARNNRIPKWCPIDVKVEDIENQLSKETSVIAVIAVQETFIEANSTNNFIDLPTYDTYNDSYHAVTIVGFGVDNKNDPYFLIRNSWGTLWGDQGYGFLSYEYFNKYQAGAWIIT
ncbi:C1 family peptidase [Peribacillus simplex]|uniref:C1 family peptidase n=1 Tax=Peribacillus simplex TaxID=1478 RepID=UPI0019221524|nr:C1 family peptidase [Peribacillus simplex]MBD8591212.1 C1 family peptidase [Peribacillus simplex]